MKTSVFSQMDIIGRLIPFIRRPNVSLQKTPTPDDSVFPESGLIVMKGAVSQNDCLAAIRDYDTHETLLVKHGCPVSDSKGRNFRVNNLHMYSESLLKIGTTKSFHDVASSYFGRRSLIHTSLSYKHGSQQVAHIDTPFFWTNPINMYIGVWVALEDVKPDAGPLFYYEGSHKYFNSVKELTAVYEASDKNVNRMFEIMHDVVSSKCKRVELCVNQGDAILWHPGVMHGGTFASDRDATRYSCVYHFGAQGVNVRFQTTFPNNFLNVPLCGLSEYNGQLYARKNMPKVIPHKD